MSVNLTVNGVTFPFPTVNNLSWGPVVTNWATAITGGVLQKAGGAFTLTAPVDFGSSYGLVAKSLTSKDTNPATTGVLRMGNASAGVVWRNAANGADLALTVNGTNQLTFNGIALGTQVLTDGHIFVGNSLNQPNDVAMSGDVTIDDAGATTLGANTVSDSNVKSNAGITLSKLAPTTAYYWYVANASGVLTPLGITASRVIVSDANGLPSASTVTATTLGYLDATSSIQTQLNGKQATGSYALSTGQQFTGNISFDNNATHGLVGTATNDSAAAGHFGEHVKSAVQSAGAVVTSGQFGDLTSISLTAGDWDVSCAVYAAAGGAWTAMQIGISTTSGNSTTGLDIGDNRIVASWASSATVPSEFCMSIPAYRMSLASPATVYLKVSATYSVGPSFSGRISARRAR